MKLKNLAITTFLCILFILASFYTVDVQAAQTPLKIQINNTIYQNSNQPAPVNINGRVYVPLRLVSEGLGYQVNWDDKSRSVLIDSHIDQLDVAYNNYSAIKIFINNKDIKMDKNIGMPFLSSNGYTMVPIRVVAENLGAKVEWNAAYNMVVISTNNSQNIEAVPLPMADAVPNHGITESYNLSANKVTLQGNSYASLEQMQRYLSNKEIAVRASAISRGKTFVPFPQNIAEYYYIIGQKYNIRGDVALAQALHETGNFQYGNEVKPYQNNYCGLGAIGRVTTEEDFQKQMFSQVNHDKANLQIGVHGWCYDSVATGVEAHIQHMYSYATANPLPVGCELLDGRFAHGNRGKAVYLTDLNGKWAVPGNNYGEIIYNNYLAPMIAS